MSDKGIYDFMSELSILGMNVETGIGLTLSGDGFKPNAVVALEIADFKIFSLRAVATKLNEFGLAAGRAIKSLNKGKTKVKLNIGALIDWKSTEYKNTKPKFFLGITIGK